MNRKHSQGLRFASVALFFSVFLAGLSPAQMIPKSSFLGTWRMCYDGWDATLVLRDSGTPNGVIGEYVGPNGFVHKASGDFVQYMLGLKIDLNDTTNQITDDQYFKGYMFLQTRNQMAGTTQVGLNTYGWMAEKTSSMSTLPHPQAVSSDTPDSKGPKDPASSGKALLKTSKAEYLQGETITFELVNTGSKAIPLQGSVYIIERRDEDGGREFYTGPTEQNPGATLGKNHTKTWSWDGWDNEHLKQARAGRWRLKYVAPEAWAKPLVVHFQIKKP